jgi:histidyl-tRNA synthetase
MKKILTKAPYKGCRDLFPKEKRLQNYLFQHMSQVAQQFGYEPYDGPLLEPVELYLAKSGEELINEQIYSFMDRGERQVAIRPEMTPTLARMIANVHREISKPIRWYSIPNLMRYERPQKGRLREHWQLNVDIFGAPSPFAEVEIWQLIAELFFSFGAKSNHFSFQINDRRIVDTLLEKLALTQEQRYKFYKLIDRCKKITPEQLTTELEQLVQSPQLRSIALEYLQLNSLKDLSQWMDRHHLAKESMATIEQAFHMGAQLGLETLLCYDPSIVRGLDYYTGLVFEVFDQSPDNRRALCGGGSYDRLLEIFGDQALPGVGFGLGDVTLVDFLSSHDLLPKTEKNNLDIYVSYQVEEAQIAALQVAQALRRQQLQVEMAPGVQKYKKVFSLADQKDIKALIFIGEEEFKKQYFQYKILATQEQGEYPLASLDEFLTKLKK